MTKRNDSQQRFSRREMLGLIGAAGVIAVVGCGDDDQPSSSEPAGTATRSATASSTPATTASATPEPIGCVITPEQTEGPYFV